LELSDEDKRKLAQIMREELPQKTAEKPPFPYGRHLYWTLMTGGLWAPVWIYKSLMHDHNWRKSQRMKKDGI